MTVKVSEKNKFFKKIRPKKTTMTGKFLVILLASAVLAILCFRFLYQYRDPAYFFLYKHGFLHHDRADWIEKFLEKAPETVIQPDNKDKKAMNKVIELIKLRDYYSGIIVYNHDTGDYITSFYPMAINDNSLIFRIAGEQSATYQIEMDEVTTIQKTVAFKDQVADVYFFSYHFLSFYPWYLGASLIFCVFVFLLPILIFLHRKMREIRLLKNEILSMADGNLEHTIVPGSRDEIGILAGQLDFLRKSLKGTIEEERESREANSDLIRAMSHDLRTPLTILSGYLEIVKLHRGDPAMEEQYLDACLNKALEIRQLSDRMFEYALVYETQETLDMEEVAIAELLTLLWENVNFMELAGFTVEVKPEAMNISKAVAGTDGNSSLTDVKADSGNGENTATFSGNSLALKRVFNNLFSNILKYGDKAHPVKAAFSVENGHWRLSLSNHIKQSDRTVESNHIGLKSVEKIIELHGGSVYSMQAGDVFSVEVMV